jgi:D-cysteine desulfhydrase
MLQDYTPPAFSAVCDGVVPTKRLALAHLPTPIEPIRLPNTPEDVAVYLKRDDMTGGIELTGNKVRKLEFILADALTSGAQRVFTTGGSQSNHARATAAACAKLGIPCELFLRRDPSNGSGNAFLDTLLGATVKEFSREEIKERQLKAEDGDWVADEARRRSKELGQKVVSIPVGGSNTLGMWGYIQAVDEISKQVNLPDFSAIVSASGSGGTVAGLGVGMEMLRRSTATPMPRVLSYGICDTPNYFHDVVDRLAVRSWKGCPSSKDIIDMRDAAGEGYGKNTSEQLQYLSLVARQCGVIFDTCYSGKCLFEFGKDIARGSFAGQRLLFVHTGGAPSTFDKKDRYLLGDPSL